MKVLIQWIAKLWNGGLDAPSEEKPLSLSPVHRQFLDQTVKFYNRLSTAEKRVFERRVLLFLETTRIHGEGVEVCDEDRLLVASGAIIPVWAFPKWHYFNLQDVYLVPATFNRDFECFQPDSRIEGAVGTGPMSGKMILSQPALHYGFSNDMDKNNVAIHEFVHLIDMADGNCDGFPERLSEYVFSIPWLKLVQHKIKEIENKQSNIRDYGATSDIEFFAVASEYFFERPKMLKKKHPEVYYALRSFYRQEAVDINEDIRILRTEPCPCGSGVKYKACCIPVA